MFVLMVSLSLLLVPCTIRSQSYVKTDGQSASLSWCQAPIWGPRPDFYYCQTFAGLLMRGTLSDEMTGLSFTIAAGPRQQSFSDASTTGLMTMFCCLRFETTPTWRARSPYLYSSGTGWPGYITGCWVPFSLPPTTRRATVEVLEPASTRGASSPSLSSVSFLLEHAVA
jgi:hypothetical protein